MTAAVAHAPRLAPAQVRVEEIQRARLLAAAVSVVEELGYADATVGHITARARVSRRTFYELFSNCEECLVAVMDDALQKLVEEIEHAERGGLSWLARVRSGLWAILSFFDREPTLARLCVVQSLGGSETVLQRRAEVLSRLAATVDEGRCEGPKGADAPSLTAEGLVGAAHAIVYERLLKRSAEPLTGMHGQLMGMIALPYLGTVAARREQARSRPTPAISNQATRESSWAENDPLEGVRMRLTYRTALVLECIAQAPGISNRRIGDRAGIADQGQTSKLLARLERLGLAFNANEDGHAKGEANAWHLTDTGIRVVESIGARPAQQEAV